MGPSGSHNHHAGSMNTVDCIIIGCGPAGAATGICLRQAGFRVVLAERSGYASWRVGETLPPIIKRPLQQLGAWETFLKEKFLPSQGIESVWGDPFPVEAHFIFNPYGNGWHINRKRFDRMMAEEAGKSGCVLLLNTALQTAHCKDNIWEATLKQKNSLLAYKAKILVDATGRPASIARKLGSKKARFDRLIALAGLLHPEKKTKAPSPFLLLEATATGWWYSAPLPGGELLATFLTDSDLVNYGGQDVTAFWKTHLNQTAQTLNRARGYRLKGKINVRPAESSCLDKIGSSNWLSVGDAAYSVDPLSGNGIYKALESGIAAAGLIRRYLEGDEQALTSYFSNAKYAFERYLSTRYQYYLEEQRWAQSLFWQRRHNSLHVLDVDVEEEFLGQP